MSGQRRANWRTEMDAVIDAHLDQVGKWQDIEAERRLENYRQLWRELTAQRDRIVRLERLSRRYAIAMALGGIGGVIMAVTR